MSWVTPLGFIGFIGVAALIAIYLIKPNYQNKIISSTFVWKLSLKYQKKRIPIDRFRNILLFIAQLLLLTACAFLLAKPVIFDEAEVFGSEKIAVIEASCNMRAKESGETRFERAVKEVKELAGNVAEKGGLITVILAGSKAELVAEQSSAENLAELYDLLDELIAPGNLRCGYGSADMDGAVAMAEEYTKNNPTAEVAVYTAADYLSEGGAEVVDVSAAGEWNAAVLDGKAENIDNFYVFSADIAVYGRDTDVLLNLDVYDTNFDKKTISLQFPVRCN
ncbi:MAG: BatA and WFA domain-containing protein, partial [Clostridia bacterium]|nr:BatA and WFA domain-containing protein [Clostridia bacterium]